TATVRIRPALLVAAGVVSVVSMIYLSYLLIAQDVAQRGAASGPAIWQLLLIWLAVGTALYLIARWEGRREGFDYKTLLIREWQEEAEKDPASPGDASNEPAGDGRNRLERVET